MNVGDLNGALSQINTSFLFTTPPPPHIVNNANFSTDAHTTKSAAWRVPCASVLRPYRPGSASQCNGTDYTAELVGCASLLLKLALLTPVFNAPRLIDAPVTTAPPKY